MEMDVMRTAKWSSVACLLLMALVLTGSIWPRRPAVGAGLEAMYFGHDWGGFPDVGTWYYPVQGAQLADDTIEEVDEIITTPGTFTAIRMGVSGDIGPAGDDADLTLMV